MRSLSIVFALVLMKRSDCLSMTDCGIYYKRPEYTDISVECGSTSILLAVQACPVIYTGYNESLLVLNGNMYPTCQGTLDTTVQPPVVRFQFPLNYTNSCGSNFYIRNIVGTGEFADFSNVQIVNISGVIRSKYLTTGQVTYNTDLKYFYSCSYPLEYLINNTQVDVSASSIAVKDNNGSFISTLSLQLYQDRNYTTLLKIPPQGIELRTSIYVQVKATNLTSQYYVLLDRCYASISPLPTNSTFFNLFVSCDRDRQTVMVENGQSQNARFYFPAFRFIEQQNETVSTYYLHCITRLCERHSCNTFHRCNSRRRRDTQNATPPPPGLSDSTTITSPPIITRAESILASKEQGSTTSDGSNVIGLGMAVSILVLACIGVIIITAILYRQLKMWTGGPKVSHS